jgi:RNA polymerase sigma factor (sigma-70 family)
MTITNGRPTGALRDLGLLAEGEATAGLSDETLLGRFLGSRDESSDRAFAALVARHGPMVRGVCRRVLRDPADVGDAFQATFLVLARRAGSVRVDGSLAPWLHGVSVRVARRARAIAARRNGRERTNLETPEIPARDDRDAAELRAAIDEELRRLPGRYGSALVLFYLEGLSHEEAAGRLGCPVGTVRSRLSRGRELLRDRLARRGLAPASPSLMVAAFAPRSSLSLEALGSMARAASRLAAGRVPGGSVPPGVATLVAGVSRMMTLQKLAPVAAVSAACLLGALGLAMGQSPKPSAAPTPKAAPAEKAQKPEPVETPGVEAGMDPGAFLDFPAFVVKTEPPTGSIDVDPALAEVRVTFSREMKDGSWSWVTLSKETFPEITGKIHYNKDRRTCVAPVKLEPGKTYAIFVNSTKFTNFRDLEGRPAVPTLLVFKTRAAR